MRITRSDFDNMIAELNRLEALIHPIDSSRYINGRIWNYNLIEGHGVYISRGMTNPMYTSKRVSNREAWVYLLAVQQTLQYNLDYGIEHS
jgi:hypothetical protein